MQVNVEKRIVTSRDVVRENHIDIDMVEHLVNEIFKISDVTGKVFKYLQEMNARRVFIWLGDNSIISEYDRPNYNPEEVDMVFFCDYADMVYIIEHLKQSVPNIFSLTANMSFLQAKAILSCIDCIAKTDVHVTEVANIINGGRL